MKNLITMLCLSGLLAICSLSYAGDTAISAGHGGRNAWVIIDGNVWVCWYHDSGTTATCYQAEMKEISQ